MFLIQQFFLATSRTFVGVESSENGDEKDDESGIIDSELLSGVEGISSFLMGCKEDDEEVIASSKL